MTSFEENVCSLYAVGRKLRSRVPKGEESKDVAHVMWREQTEKLALRFVGWIKEFEAIEEELDRILGMVQHERRRMFWL